MSEKNPTQAPHREKIVDVKAGKVVAEVGPPDAAGAKDVPAEAEEVSAQRPVADENSAKGN